MPQIEYPVDEIEVDHEGRTLYAFGTLTVDYNWQPAERDVGIMNPFPEINEIVRGDLQLRDDEGETVVEALPARDPIVFKVAEKCDDHMISFCESDHSDRKAYAREYYRQD